jgi:hypothetical protein
MKKICQLFWYGKFFSSRYTDTPICGIAQAGAVNRESARSSGVDHMRKHRFGVTPVSKKHLQ